METKVERQAVSDCKVSYNLCSSVNQIFSHTIVLCYIHVECHERWGEIFAFGDKNTQFMTEINGRGQFENLRQYGAWAQIWMVSPTKFVIFKVP